MKEGGGESAKSKPESGFVARARARIARMNQAAEARRQELGLPPEAKYDLLQPADGDQRHDGRLEGPVNQQDKPESQ